MAMNGTFGFVPVRKRNGDPFNGGMNYAYIQEGSQIYAKGDVLAENDSATSESTHTRFEVAIGHTTAATAIGVAQYFEYTSTDGNFFQTMYIPAAVASGNTALANRIKVFYYSAFDDTVWAANSKGGALASTDMMANYDIGIGTADAKTQLSGHYVLASTGGATTIDTPLRLIGLVDRPNNTWGTGTDTAPVLVEVAFNATSLYNAGNLGLT